MDLKYLNLTLFFQTLVTTIKNIIQNYKVYFKKEELYCIGGTYIKIKYDFKIPIKKYVRKFTLVKTITIRCYCQLSQALLVKGLTSVILYFDFFNFKMYIFLINRKMMSKTLFKLNKHPVA